MTQKELESYLWGAATYLRGFIDAGDYKQYIFPLLFFKRICDVYDEEYEEALAESDGDLEYAAFDENHRFKVPAEAHWNQVRQVTVNVGQAISKALNEIQKVNAQQLQGIFGDADWTNKERLSDAMLCQLIEHFSSKNLNIKNVPNDELGNAYEFLIKKFADDSGHTAAEFYTNRTVVRLMTLIADPHEGDSVYDPTCGSGSLLLRTARNGNADEIFGQEKNPTTFNLARMNMLLHGVKYRDFDIQNGDTLEKDEFGERQFDAVVANPPFSAEWSADARFNNDDRFSKAGVLAPKSKADYAFILHMIYHLNDGGTMACVAPHGVLFRGAAEGKIRQFLIEKKNYIDAIIGLPANIFYGTSIPTCILVMKKCRKEDDNILFIDASKEFEKVKTQNKLRQEHIDKIVSTYRERKEIEKYSHCASLQEIKDNDYNLNIPRYVDTFEEEEEIDIKAVMAEIKELEAKRAELDAQIDVYLKELGII